jgi:hypothetical protein
MKDARSPIPPAPDVLDRIHLELTEGLLQRVKRYALRRVGAKRVAGLACFDDELEAEHMATDAATLTILGHRTWDPRVPLFEHLCGVIRSTSSDEIEHHNKFTRTVVGRLSMDESHGDDAELDRQLNQRGAIDIQRPAHVFTLADARDHLVTSLRFMSRTDAQVTKLLDAYRSGCEDRADVLACTNMTADEYRNARRKLDRLLEALPEHIKEGAADALEVSYGF